MLKNKKIYTLLIIPIIIATYFIFEKTSNIFEKDIFAELKSKNIEITGDKEDEKMLKFSTNEDDLDWELINSACKNGGYNISSYRGKKIWLTIYPINKAINKTPASVFILSKNYQIICMYISAQDGHFFPPPGIYPINYEFLK